MCGAQSQKAAAGLWEQAAVALGCVLVTLAAVWPRSHGAKGENESVASVYAKLEKQQTLPWASASRPGIHQATLVAKDRRCADRISIREQEEMITREWQGPSQAAFTPKPNTAANSRIHPFSTRLSL